MTHWAEIDANNVVLRVTKGCNDSESAHQWLVQNLGGTWVQARYNDTVSCTANYPGIGYTYDAQSNTFTPPKPYPSWVLDEAGHFWKAPVAEPANGGPYRWDEATTSWVTP